MRARQCPVAELAGFAASRLHVRRGGARRRSTRVSRGRSSPTSACRGMNGLQLFERIKAVDADMPVILVTGHGDIDLAVAALQGRRLRFHLQTLCRRPAGRSAPRALEKRRLVLENRRLRAAAGRRPEGPAADRRRAGNAPVARDVRQIADIDVDVLIEGETGTGKEVVARAFASTGAGGARRHSSR